MTRLASFAALALLSCSPDSGSPEISVVDAWARATVTGQSSAAAYATLRNAGSADDRLLAVTTPAASRAMLHGTEMREGVARMRGLDGGIAVPAGTTVTLAPGGTHIMLTGLGAPLRAGETVELGLRFERSGERRVTAIVRDPAAGAAGGSH